MPNFRGDHATLRHARLSTTARLETGTRIRVEYSAGHTGDAPDGIHRPRYVDISIKSTSEVDYQLELARDLGVMSHDVWKPLAKEVIELRKMLSALRRSVLAAAARDKTLRPPKQASRKPRRNVSTKRPSELTPEDAGTDD